MATLYELTEEYRQLLEMMEDDTVDPEVLQDTLEGVVFRVNNLTRAGVIVDIFKGYGIGKMSYSITQKQEEEENE